MIWLAILVCFAVSFVFSGTEAGLLSVNRVRLKHRLKHRDKSAIILNRLLEHPERLLVTVLLVTNLMNIFAITLASQQFVRFFGTATMAISPRSASSSPSMSSGSNSCRNRSSAASRTVRSPRLAARCGSPTCCSRRCTSSGPAWHACSSATARASAASSSSPARISNTSPSKANARAPSAGTSGR